MTFKKIMIQLLSVALFSSSQLVVLAEEDTADSVESEENAEVNDENKEVDPDDQIEIKLDGPLRINQDKLLEMPSNIPTKLSLGPEAVVEYPEDGVKGIFSTGSTAGTKRFDELIDLVNSTELNSMVVDVKEDYGDIVLNLDSDNELINEATNAHTH